MFKCKRCGRKFKTKQELGGHVANAHPKDTRQLAGQSEKNKEQTLALPPASEKSQPSPSPTPGEEVPPPPEDASETEQITYYWEKGFGFEQLTTVLGFKPSTVRLVLSKMVEPEGKPTEGSGTETLPMILKDGKGEVIAPEAVYRQLVLKDGLDGERDFRALMKWAACIEMVQRMTQIRKGEAEAFAEMVKPMLDMMDKSRQELDAAAARAKESSMEMAETAAMGAVGGVLGRIDAKFEELKKQKADIATVENPMQGFMARAMESMWERMLGIVTPGRTEKIPGLVDERAK